MSSETTSILVETSQSQLCGEHNSSYAWQGRQTFTSLERFHISCSSSNSTATIAERVWCSELSTNFPLPVWGSYFCALSRQFLCSNKLGIDRLNTIYVAMQFRFATNFFRSHALLTKIVKFAKSKYFRPRSHYDTNIIRLTVNLNRFFGDNDCIDNFIFLECAEVANFVSRRTKVLC